MNGSNYLRDSWFTWSARWERFSPE